MRKWVVEDKLMEVPEEVGGVKNFVASQRFVTDDLCEGEPPTKRAKVVVDVQQQQGEGESESADGKSKSNPSRHDIDVACVGHMRMYVSLYALRAQQRRDMLEQVLDEAKYGERARKDSARL